MSDEPIEIERGSGNLFRDLGVEDAELRQFKALLAAEIIKTLDDRELTVRSAATQTGFAAADFSRIRTVKLERFTVDRLMTILSRLGQEVRVTYHRFRRHSRCAATGAVPPRSASRRRWCG